MITIMKDNKLIKRRTEDGIWRSEIMNIWRMEIGDDGARVAQGNRRGFIGRFRGRLNGVW